MGNCLKSQTKEDKITRMDGKILKYKASTKAGKVLSQFKGPELSDMLPVQHYLAPNTQLVVGCMPAPPAPTPTPPPTPKVCKTVRFSEPESTQVGDSKKSSLRIKIVISRHELKQMLANGVVSKKDVIPELQTTATHTIKITDKCYSNEAWRPALNCIPEVDLYK